MGTPIMIIEYKIIGIKGKEIIDIEEGYVNLDEVKRDIPYWQDQYPDYIIDVEEY